MEGERLPRSPSAETAGLAVAALIVAGGFLGSRGLGLLRSVVIAGTHGTSPELDAYWVAFRLPDLVFQLLAGATLASAFIPVFSRLYERSGRDDAWHLASSVLNLVFLATAAFAAIAALLAPWLVPVMAPGLGEEEGRQEELRDLAVELTRLMLISPVLFAVSGMFMGILNARRRFLTPALAPMAYNLSIIVAALVSDDVRALAAGVVAGAGLHLAVQVPDLWLAGMRYGLVAGWRDPAVREVALLMAPRVLGLAAGQLNLLITVFFASTLVAGAISAANFAALIFMTPLGLIGMAISTAVFPTLATQAAREERRELGETLARSLRLILFLSLPAGVGMMVLGKPLVVLLLQRGAFGAASADLTAQALLFYAAGLFAHSGIEILSRGFYALGDTRTPVLFAVLSMLLNLALCAALVGALELRGLALALSIAATAEFAGLYITLGRRIPEIASTAVRRSVLQSLGALAALTVVCLAALVAVDSGLGLSASRPAGAALALATGAVAGATAYAGVAVLLGSEEPRPLLAPLPGVVSRGRGRAP